MKTAVRLIACFLAATLPARGAEDLFANRPAFSGPEEPARQSGRCDQIRGQAEGLGDPTDRIDLSVDGRLTAVQSDGALWYLVMCNLPDLRIMCVTYEGNDMKPGDKVVIKGAYRRVDANHALLDPCLASPLEGDEPAQVK